MKYWLHHLQALAGSLRYFTNVFFLHEYECNYSLWTLALALMEFNNRALRWHLQNLPSAPDPEFYNGISLRFILLIHFLPKSIFNRSTLLYRLVNGKAELCTKDQPTRKLIQYFLTSRKEVPDNGSNQVQPNWNLENIIPRTWEGIWEKI